MSKTRLRAKVTSSTTQSIMRVSWDPKMAETSLFKWWTRVRCRQWMISRTLCSRGSWDLKPCLSTPRCSLTRLSTACLTTRAGKKWNSRKCGWNECSRSCLRRKTLPVSMPSHTGSTRNQSIFVLQTWPNLKREKKKGVSSRKKREKMLNSTNWLSNPSLELKPNGWLSRGKTGAIQISWDERSSSSKKERTGETRELIKNWIQRHLS